MHLNEKQLGLIWAILDEDFKGDGWQLGSASIFDSNLARPNTLLKEQTERHKFTKAPSGALWNSDGVWVCHPNPLQTIAGMEEGSDASNLQPHYDTWLYISEYLITIRIIIIITARDV